MVKIEYVKWGLANRFKDGIELNENLKKFPRLHQAILEHELGHKDNNTFKDDFVHDLTPVNKLHQKEVVVFMIKHPRSLTQLLPFYWSAKRKQIIYDINMMIIYGVFLGLVLLGYYLIR